MAAASIIATATFLQLGYIGIGYSDQIDLGRAGLERAVGGESPYGVLYRNATGGQNPLAYGPLAMLTALGGVPLELVASALLLGLIAWARTWLTLCVVAGFPPYIYHAATGLNDYSVSLILTGSLLALPYRPRLAMIGLAVAAAVKPYAAAWFFPAIGLSGLGAAAWLVGASAILWTPVLFWGVGSYVESLRLISLVTTPAGWASNSIPLPWVRGLGIPIALSGLLARQWHVTVLIGSTAFAAVMFFGEWASLGYWVALLPITGIAVERTWLARELQPVPSR